MKTPPKTGTVKVDFKLPGRTIYNLSKTIGLDAKFGQINLIRSVPIVTRDRHEICIRGMINTFPTKAPVMNPALVRVYAFWVPFRLYMPELRLNDASISLINGKVGSNFTNAPFPVAPYPGSSLDRDYQYASDEGDIDAYWSKVVDNISISNNNANPNSSDLLAGSWSNYWVQKHSLLEQIGFEQRATSAIGLQTYLEILRSKVRNTEVTDARFDNLGSTPKTYNAFRVLAYYDIFRNYFANPNEEFYPIYVNPPEVTTAPTPCLSGLPFQSLQDYFNNQMFIDSWAVQNDPVGILDDLPSVYAGPSKVDAKAVDRLPWQDVYGNGLTSMDAAGIVTKCHLPDINSTFIGSAQYQNVIARSVVNVVGNQLNLNDLLVGERLYNYYQKQAAVGGRFDEFMYAEYGVDIRKYLDIPTFIRSWSFELGFNAVVSTNAPDPTQTTGLGQLGGRGVGSLSYDPSNKKSRNANMMAFSSDEPGELMFLLTIDPKPSYSTGIDWSLLNQRFDDFYTPSLDRLGMQPVFRSQVNTAITPSNQLALYNDYQSASMPSPFEDVIGYQPAWTEYKSETNRVMGDLADRLAYWSLLRDTSVELPIISEGGQLDGYWGYTSYIIPSMYNTPFQDTTEEGYPFICQFCFDHVVKRAMSARTMTGFAEGSL